MIESLLPALAGAELFHDVPEATMFAAEAAVVQSAGAERRREFGTARYCARQALAALGEPVGPILKDRDGAPRWPAGLVGSMTHCAGYRAAVVGRGHEWGGVGIDAEPHTAVPNAVRDFILRAEERARLSVLADARPGLHGDRLLFCIKEAVYKAWFPLTRRWLDYADVSVTVHLDNSFQARIRVPNARAAGVDLERFAGRWTVDRGLVVAATTVGRSEATPPTTLAGVT